MLYKDIKKSKIKSGYSLIELVVTIAIAGAILVTIYLALLYAIKVNLRATHMTTAYEAAEQEIEYVRNTAFANLTNQTNGPFWGNINLSNLPAGTGTLTIQDYQSNPQIKEVIVTVSWQEKNLAKQYILTTLRTSGGIGE